MNILFIVLIVLLCGISAGCNSVVNNLAFHPDSNNVISTDKLPLGVEEFSVTTKDGIEIRSLYLPNEKSNRILIYFHGNAGNIYHRIPSLRQLQSFGVSVVGVSYRGYGKSDGTPSEEGLYSDGNAIYRYVIDSLGFTEKNIIIFGRSIGTTVAINTAQDKSLNGLILIAPLSSGFEQAKAMGVGLVSSVAGKSFDNLSKIKNVKSPLLVLHGTHDRVIPFAMGQAIYKNANTQKLFVKIDGAGHNNLHNKFGTQYWAPILKFINQTGSS